MLLLEKISLVAILGLCILSLCADGQKNKKGCSEKSIKRNYQKFSQIRNRVNTVLTMYLTSASEKVDKHVDREDRAETGSLLLKVGDLHFQDGRGFSGLSLKGLKLTDLGLDDIKKFQIYMVELEALLKELNRVDDDVIDKILVKEDFSNLKGALNRIHKDASKLTGKIKACLPRGNTNVDALIEQYKTQIESSRPTRTRRDTQEHSASSSSILLRKIRSLVGRERRQEPGAGERTLQHSQWVLQDLQNLLQHDVILTLDSMANKNKRRRGHGSKKKGSKEGKAKGKKRSD
ncbi:Hypp2163 [Branchiostoma lanceolatum]|uniref:Hypp2163 protein n=1 Tax=Branchiostoma lanceolatum TaxID=7740 RepID=A0A8J9ZP73_BRALA|nr:Hypp2163 [Branchiostoma lanceolatum]